MAKFLDKFKVRTAWEGRKHTKDLSCEHITTTDFMKLAPVYYHNMIPKETLKVDFRAFSRLASMPVPTFGRANMNIRCFFVPFRVVMPAWNDFITDAVHSFNGSGSAIPSSVRKVSNISILSALTYSGASTSGTSTDFDFKTINTTTNTTSYYKFTGYGRHHYKVLLSLGYAPNFVTSNNDSFYFNALPLLAAAKVFLDWYWPSAYVGDPNYQVYNNILCRDANGDTLSGTEVYQLLSLFDSVSYDSDYFVSAFDNPNGPTSGLSSNVNIVDPSYSSSNPPFTTVASGTNLGTPFVNEFGSYDTDTGQVSSNFTQYSIEALHRLTDYMKRHQLAGARAIDRYLARFGLTLSSEKTNRSVYLGSHQVPLMTGDVMSTSDTLTSSNGSRIGDYAGKGFLVGKDGHFEYQTDEYGLFLICSSVVPEVGYFSGVDRHNMHLTRLDFATPEFDGMGTRAIAKAELFLGTNPDVKQKDAQEQVFGFTPQYAEYKVGRDFLTGDFRIRTLSASGDTSNAWHLFREVDGIVASGNGYDDLVHNRDFVLGLFDRTQYNRIFYNTNNTADHFYVHYFFGVTSSANLLPLYDDYDFHNDEGKERVLDVNGVKMN